MTQKIAVLMGGNSSEREISLKSGRAVMQALQNLPGINPVAIDVAEPFIHQLETGGFSKAFIALHGRGGEDGTVQGLLEFLKIPYTGSKVLGSALAMDKLRTKYIWQSCEIPTPDFLVMEKNFDAKKIVDRLGLPLMIKPANEGSSIGMSKVENIDALLEAFQLASELDACVIAERWIAGEEYTVPILADAALPIIHLKVTQRFYDYHAKYERNDTQYLIPSGLSEDKEKQIKELALKAYTVLGGQGWGRLDLMCDYEGNPWFLEANTVPGLTDHSLVPMSAKAAGIDFNALIEKILKTAI